MRTLVRLIALALLVASFGLVAQTTAQVGGGGRPPQFTPAPLTPGTVLPAPPPAQPKGGTSISLFGMNLYLTGLERSVNEANTLGALAAAGGVQWSREELSWANLEPQSKGNYNWSPYDQRLAADTNNGINVIGMLLTTPRWASSNPSAPDWFWYEPNNPQDYYDFVYTAVNRWKGQIHVWEIWNEPNHAATWNCPNNCDRAVDYAVLLQAAYVAVKRADPTARVLIGGLYIHDTGNEGMAFLDRVVAASGGNINFDGLSIHTYMPDRVPESVDPQTLVQNFQYRLYMANNWIDAHGGQPSEIWLTEEGRSTWVGCPYAYSEDEQASFLARMYGIAASTPRLVQFSWFQFEDKFNHPSNLYGGMSIVRDDYSLKPGYSAYQTAQRLLDGVVYSGPGPAMEGGNNQFQPDTSDYVGFDYRFVHNGQPLHMLWRPFDSVAVNYPVETAQVDVVDRDGSTTRLTATGGMVPLTLGPRPQYVLNVGCGGRFSDVCPDYWAFSFIEYMAQQGIVSGYGDGTFRPGNTATRAQLCKMITVARGWAIQNPASPSFVDVPTTHPFYPYIETARANGAVSGYSCGAGCTEFRPNNNVTRAQISKIIVVAFAWPSNLSGAPHFSDVPPTDPFYPYVETAFNHGIISGYGSEFRPGNNATRAQLSKMLYGALTTSSQKPK